MNRLVILAVFTPIWLSSFVAVCGGYLYGLLLNNPDITESSKSENNASSITNVLKEVRCRNDSQCPDDTFCDRHYGYCDVIRQEGDNCREDFHCENNLICMFGKCKIPAKPGHKGARCQVDSDCRRNSCCARKHGEKVCQSLIPKGHRCYVPDGGLEYSINEICPCEAGFVCAKVRAKRKKSLLRDWGFKTVLEEIRCTNIE